MATKGKFAKIAEALAPHKIEFYCDGIGNFGCEFNGYSLLAHLESDQFVPFYNKWATVDKANHRFEAGHIIPIAGDTFTNADFENMTVEQVVTRVLASKAALLAQIPAAKFLKQSPSGGPIRRNLLIVFEGVDNSGKTTISKKLAKKMKWFEWAKEPCFSTKYADYLNSAAFKGKDALREVKYLQGRLSRQDFYHDNAVLLDRYLWSGLAYAKAFSPSIFSFCEALYTEFSIFKKPDLIFYMRTPLATCYDREPALKKEPGRLERIEDAYMSTKHLLTEKKVPIVEIDGRMSIDECVDFCYKAIVKRFRDQVILKV